jgi:hypothetical protein
MQVETLTHPFRNLPVTHFLNVLPIQNSQTLESEFLPNLPEKAQILKSSSFTTAISRLRSHSEMFSTSRKDRCRCYFAEASYPLCVENCT